MSKITRRDFINGTLVAAGATILPLGINCVQVLDTLDPLYYPPSLTGLRGSHEGSSRHAHSRAWEGKSDWGPTTKLNEEYDLIVVGGGISGLSAAFFYQQEHGKDKRVLILDNHDDFGGHAKRNEFTLDDRLFIGYGGTMLMVAPKSYPTTAKQVIRELGFDFDRQSESHHENLFASHGAGRVSFFDKETFGADYLASGKKKDIGESIADAPLSTAAKAEFERLFTDKKDYLAGMTTAERRAVLASHSWREYLETYAGIGEEVLTFVQRLPNGVWAIGADALPAWMAADQGYAGFAGMDLGYDDGDEEENEGFYFPDGNASIARLLVRKMIPTVAPGNSVEDIVSARFDYSKLDQPENSTRIRLSSTVVGLSHQDGKLDSDVDVTYVSGDKSRTVTANKLVWAGYHTMLPHICPDVSAEQATALGTAVRAPLVYTNVLIRNWRSLVKLGVQRAYCPGSFFQTVMFTHPVSMGDYRFSQSPDEPVVLHMEHIPLAPGLPAAEQFRAGRQFLLETGFETFEYNVRDQLGRMLGPGGFDPASDIAGITVNRWSHGYAYSVDEESGDVAWSTKRWPHERRPWVDARQSIGNIVIAGTDAASNAMTESAIEEAHRAVHELA